MSHDLDTVVTLPSQPRQKFSTAEFIELENALDQPQEAPPPSSSNQSAQQVLDEVSATRGKALDKLGTLIRYVADQVVPHVKRTEP